MNTQRATNKNVPTANFFETGFRLNVPIFPIISSDLDSTMALVTEIVFNACLCCFDVLKNKS